MHQTSAFKLNFIVYDVQNVSYSSHGAPCPTRDLFPCLNTRVKVHICMDSTRISEKTFFVPHGFGGYLLTIEACGVKSLYLPVYYTSRTIQIIRNRTTATIQKQKEKFSNNFAPFSTGPNKQYGSSIL